jgi:hypothetical protein
MLQQSSRFGGRNSYWIWFRGNGSSFTPSDGTFHRRRLPPHLGRSVGAAPSPPDPALEPPRTSPALTQPERQSRPACRQVPRPTRRRSARLATLPAGRSPRSAASPRLEASRAGWRPLLAPKTPPPAAVSPCRRPPPTVWMVRRSGEK